MICSVVLTITEETNGTSQDMGMKKHRWTVQLDLGVRCAIERFNNVTQASEMLKLRNTRRRSITCRSSFIPALRPGGGISSSEVTNVVHHSNWNVATSIGMLKAARRDNGIMLVSFVCVSPGCRGAAKVAEKHQARMPINAAGISRSLLYVINRLIYDAWS